MQGDPDPGANLIGRHPKFASLLALLGGVYLLYNGVEQFQGITHWFMSSMICGCFLLSSADALGRNYKPKASRFPFGHTSTKRSLIGLWMSSHSCLYMWRLMTSWQWMNILWCVVPFLMNFWGVTLFLKGCGYGVHQRSSPFLSLADELRAYSIPPFFAVKALLRLEPLYKSSYPVWIVSGLKQMKAISDKTLNAIDIAQLFKPNTVFFGFGCPNVFLGMVLAGHQVMCVAAKSLKRAPTAIVTALGKVQSGVFFVPTNLTNEMLQEIQNSAQRMVDTKEITCVRTNAMILADAGFSIPNHQLGSFTLPHKLLQAILENGLYYKRTEIVFEIVRTTELPLADYVLSIRKAVVATPLRHLQKHRVENPKERAERAREAELVASENAERLIPSGTQEAVAAIRIWTSEISDIGWLVRLITGAHPMYRIAMDGVEASAFCNIPLGAFPNPEPSLPTQIKRDWLFCSFILDWLSSHLARTFKPRRAMAKMSLASALPVNQVRNFVVTDHEFVIVRVGDDLMSWALGKHVLAAMAAGAPLDSRGFPVVRGAGEVRTDGHGNFYINGNSGTYMPTPEQVENVAKLARALFPQMNVIVEQ